MGKPGSLEAKAQRGSVKESQICRKKRYEAAPKTFEAARVGEYALMANPVPAGSDVSAGTYRCSNCGHELDVGSTKHLPPCPECGNGSWETMSGGDSVDDPYPNQN